ncbi:tryptophan-rich sensory protein [bacterium]|nr:tryptophan-rich sensory protein [bacterium]
MNAKNIGALAAWIGVSELAGVVGSAFTFSAISDWYAFLNKPFFSPPNWLFGPVWTTLYAMMGVAAFLVWRHGWKKPETRHALTAFGVQLALNALWSILFFGARRIDLALIEIVALWIAIVLTIVRFSRVSPKAAALLLPYLAWVSFASALNVALWTLN